MNSSALRSSFLNYFGQHQHQVCASSRLIPEADPTLLFTNAGMNQFKEYFLGLTAPSFQRAVSCQKCVRAGGKHNDLDNVGFTARHHTFFEMLGNFSFGDYFKVEAIELAWNFLTRELAIPSERLFITVFKDDDEAYDIWRKHIGIKADHLARFGEKDNFWRMGEVGPCGPCSEIYYDYGPGTGGPAAENVLGGAGDRFVEIWNLVFMQYEETANGQRTQLPKPSIDTGMGLERLAALMQGQHNNYHTDLFWPMIEMISQTVGKPYIKGDDPTGHSAAMRVLADHARSISFLIGDGVMPHNEGRGYVLRRILRRALRFQHKLGADSDMLLKLSAHVIHQMNPSYPELLERKAVILESIQNETQKFQSTLDQGLGLLETEIKLLESRGLKTLPGRLLFKLYDTFGFPFDLSAVIAAEHQIAVDEDGFQQALSESQAQARRSWKHKAFATEAPEFKKWIEDFENKNNGSQFVGYDVLHSQSAVTALFTKNKTTSVNSIIEGDESAMLFPETCFYAESGGQVGDVGIITTATGSAQVLDTQKLRSSIIHWVRVTEGEIKIGQIASLEVDHEHRVQTAQHHSATHLLHAALRDILGSHVNQAGSLVGPERLRFDFTFPRPLSKDEVLRVEATVNHMINSGAPGRIQVQKLPDAIADGALALFGEKYSDVVRSVQFGSHSHELCGGTHVSNTFEIGLFKIISETGVSSGVRRIEALAGKAAKRMALSIWAEQMEAINQFNLPRDQALNTTIGQLMNQVEALKLEIRQLQLKSLGTDQYRDKIRKLQFKGIEWNWLFIDSDLSDRSVVSEWSDRLRDQLKPGAVTILFRNEDPTKPRPFVVNASQDFATHISANQICQTLAKLGQGRGGGRVEFAQGSVHASAKAHDLNEGIWEWLQSL